MSNLTEALNRIVNWLQKNQWNRYPEIAASASWLRPGLTRTKIDSIVGDSNVQLPSEVYELYQWRNGDVIADNLCDFVGLFDIPHHFDGFGPWGFIQFERVFNAYIDRINYYMHRRPESLNARSDFHSLSSVRFDVVNIFCSVNSCETGYVVLNEAENFVPVVFLNSKGGCQEIIGQYASLTDMMLTLAESYETAYYIREDGYLGKDTKKVLEIWKKYNATKLVKAVLAKIEQAEAILPELDMNQGYDLLQELEDTFRFTGDERLLAPLIRVLRRQPTNTAADENLDYLRSIASMFLGSKGGNNVVEPLIEMLNDKYWLIRYWATIALGSIKDDRAVEPLRDLLQDNQEMVRKEASEALDKITNPNRVINPFYTHPGIATLEASAALYGMTLSDILNPNIDTIIDKLTDKN